VAKGQYLSKHQACIVRRYYEHGDTRVLTKLQELVSEIYLASDARAADKLWKSVKLQLENTQTQGATIDKLVASKDVKALAELVAALASKK
jgi:hypothetical protein